MKKCHMAGCPHGENCVHAKDVENISGSVAKSAKALLKYSLEDVWLSNRYSYKELTGTEKSLVTENEFNELVAWVKEA